MDPTIKGSDWDKVVDAVLRLAGPNKDEQLALQEWAEKEAQRILRENWHSVEIIAEALLEHRSLDNSAVSLILKDAGCPRGEPDYAYELDQLTNRWFELAQQLKKHISAGRQEEAEDVALQLKHVESRREELQTLAERQLGQKQG